MALCRCPMGPNCTVSLVTWTMCSRSVPYMGYVCPPVVVEPWLLLAHHWVFLILSLTGCEGWPWLQQTSLTTQSSCFSRTSGVIWSQPLGLLVLGPLVRVSGVGRGQPPLVPGLGPDGRCCKMIPSWLLLSLGLEVLGKGYAIRLLTLVRYHNVT